ncbi:MAG: hypothetical protein R3D85_16390 [Paracoccaceae bacterium]|nr:hypothetical protein [Paracoccaceae bacterium]MCB2132355.1 hypothetical protein [Paracoccaceae bacterium]MCB2138092.1 hypothetical protein [Paracoccaceae bacterium]MCB2159942.1 hypothetical protein [Paracoccaceae bacterium]
MCIPQLLPALGAGGAATAAGASAAATTANIGTWLSVGGSLLQGVMGYQAAKQEAAAIGEQKATEARLTATEDARTRLQYRRAMRQQTAELAARGISLDSPTVVALGQSAAQELSFASQSVRSKGDATQRELTAAQQAAKAKATSSLLKGSFSAAGTLVEKAPDLWPELLK